MIFRPPYNTVVASLPVFLMFLETLVECGRGKYIYVDSTSKDSYSINNTSSPSIKIKMSNKQRNETEESTHFNSSSIKPGTTQYHWYFYDGDQNQNNEDFNYEHLNLQPQIQQYVPPSPPPPTYDLGYHSPYYGYTEDNEIIHIPPPKYSKFDNYTYQILFLKKLFGLLGPVLFPLPFFLALMPLAIPAIPLALFVGRIHGDDTHFPNMKPITNSSVTPTISTSSTTMPVMTSTTLQPETTSSSITKTTQPPTSTMMSTPIDNSTMAGGGEGSGSGGGTTNPPPPGIGFPNPPGFPPPLFPGFPFLFLNNTFDDMHYRKNKFKNYL